MPLTTLAVTTKDVSLSRDVLAYLREANRRIQQFQNRQGSLGFHPSDYPRIYRILHAIRDAELSAGTLFCEWGCGFGVVAGLAALLEFEAYGIEIDEELAEAAREFADDCELDIEFVRGSYLPKGTESLLADDDRFAMLVIEEDEAYEELGVAVDEFDIIFAYPWPDEDELTAQLFDEFAGDGALLVTYHANGDLLVRRKEG